MQDASAPHAATPVRQDTGLAAGLRADPFAFAAKGARRVTRLARFAPSRLAEAAMSLRGPRARHAAVVAAAAREWPSLAAPASPAAHAAAAVRADGHFTAHSAAFGLAPGWFADTAEAASGVAEAVLRRGGTGILASSAEDLTAFPDLFRAGLDPVLLDAASAYFGAAAAYDGPLLFITPPDGAEGGTRMWHRDEEDLSVLKVALYLGEVGLAGGPLEVAPASPPVRRGVAGFPAFRDAEMSRILDAAGAPRPVAIPGPAGTLAFAETGLLYHRGVPPADGPRRAVYFSYFAMPSPWPWACRRPRLARAAIARMVADMTPRQQAAALWADRVARLALLVPLTPL